MEANVLLVGVIPGPKEPPHMNSFLQPLVDVLKELWTGVRMCTEKGVTVMVRAALLCVGYDIPVARKLCGYCGF